MTQRQRKEKLTEALKIKVTITEIEKAIEDYRKALPGMKTGALSDEMKQLRLEQLRYINGIDHTVKTIQDKLKVGRLKKSVAILQLTELMTQLEERKDSEMDNLTG